MVNRLKPVSRPELEMKSRQLPSDRRRPSPWYAVSVVPGEECCKLVKMHLGTRWLSSEAPRLPVPGCDAMYCDCRYRHFTDRRASVQRKEDRDGWKRHYKGDERRANTRGRRESDQT